MSLGSLLRGNYVHLTLAGILALCLGQSAFSAGPIVINEIMYHTKLTEWKEDPSAEYIELYHAGEKPVSLESWKFTSGVRFTFPAVTMVPGDFLIVASDPDAFRARNPDVTTVLGPYRGQLSNGGEKISLEDADEKEVDEVTYADSGRWAKRVSTRLKGYDDWIWRATHDGDGKSLALKSPTAKNEYAEHWTSSEIDGGTPGKQNDVYSDKIAPVVLSVNHSPAIPKSSDTVLITATADHPSPVTLSVHFRLDGETDFQKVAMTNGQAQLPAQSNKAIVQFYVQAADANGLTTTYPERNLDENDRPTLRQPTCLYQVDNSFRQEAEQAPGAKPTYRIISTAAEVAMMKRLAGMSGRSSVYDNHLHLTFIAVDGAEIDVRYNATARIRGHGSRSAFPPGMRLSFPSDDLWRGLSDINLNTQYTQSQSIGAAIHQLLGSHSAGSTPVVVQINGKNWAKKGSPQFGCYVHNEVLDGAFVERHFPDEEDGNLYRLVGNAYLNETKSNMSSFRSRYNKRNHGSDDDYSDMFTLIETLRTTSPEHTYYDRVNEIADLEQWAHYIALDTLLCNTEGGMPQGRGDDVAMFQRKSGRFQFIPYDLDSILGMGDDGQRVSQDVFGYGRMSGLQALFKNPRFLKLYTDSIIRLTETTYKPAIIHRLIDEQWSGWIPEKQIEKVKTFAVDRIANVLSQIQSSTVVASTLEREGEFYKASSATFALYGRFDHRNVTTVDVGGLKPKIFKETGMWIMPPDRLKEIIRPGMNQVPVLMRNEDGDVVQEELMRVWLDNGEVKRISGKLPDNETITWPAKEGPYLVEGEVVVPETSTLIVEAGTTVYAGIEARLLVNGDIQLIGEPTRRITFAKNPSDSESKGWMALRFFKQAQPPLTIKDTDFFDIAGQVFSQRNTTELINVQMEGNENFVLTPKAGHLRIAGSTLKQRGPGVKPLFSDVGHLEISHSTITREGSGHISGASSLPKVDLFSCTFEQPSAPVISAATGTIDGCDFKIRPSETNKFMDSETGSNVTVTRCRDSREISEGFTPRDLPAADIRFALQPPVKSSGKQVAFHVTGEGLAAFRYQTDDGPWSEPIVSKEAVHDLHLDLAPGKHVVRFVGQHVSGRWQSKERATESRTFEIIPELPAITLSEVLAINKSAHKFDGKFDDYIELHNIGTESIDLTKFSLSDDPKEAPDENLGGQAPIPAGGYRLIRASKKQKGTGFALSGSGDAVYLWHGDEIIDQVRFGLQLVDHSISRAVSGEWALSKPTPEQANEIEAVGSATGLRFTEWFAIPDLRSPDEFLELTNASKAPVDLGGMTITDRMPNKSVWTPLPPLSFIAAESSQVFLADGSPKEGADHLDFRLSNEGEAIGLFDRDGNMIDFVIYGPQSTGVSQGRSEDGSLVYATPSPGAAVAGNTPEMPSIADSIRISELHYHPSTDDDEEFVELVNVSDQPVSLDSLAFVGGIELEFAEIQLEPNARAVVVKDRKVFTKRYGTEVKIIGEYKGKLSNGGERLSLATDTGETIVEFEYKDKWHRSTDGKGYSLTLTDLNHKQLAAKKAWRPSNDIGGTPGK